MEKREETYATLLNLSEVRVRGVEVRANEIEIRIESILRQGICPRCGAKCERVRQTYQRQIRDLPISGRVVYLLLTTRQFECENCRRYFYEQFTFVAKNGQLTTRYEEYLYQRIIGTDIQYVAVKEGVCWRVLQRIFTCWGEKDIAQMDRWEGIEALGIDEIQLRSGEYACVLVDLDRGQLLEILEQRTPECLTTYFETLGTEVCEHIQVVSCDMWQSYVNVATRLFPNAQIVVDRFHFYGKLQEALDNCRKALRKKYPDKESLKRIKWLLIKNKDDLTEAELAVLRQLFADPLFNTLKEVYQARNDFRAILEAPLEREEAAAAIERWERKVSSWNNRFINSFCKTLQRWRAYVLNYFDDRYSNGVVEGINNRIKAFKRRAFGFANFANFRLRLLIQSADLH